jgi:hypothetical protein
MTVQALDAATGVEIIRHKKGYDVRLAVGGAVALGGIITIVNLFLGLQEAHFIPIDIPHRFDRAREFWHVAMGAISEAAIVAVAITIVIKINVFERITQFVRTGTTVLNDEKLEQLQRVLSEKLQADNALLSRELATAQLKNAELRDVLTQVQVIIGGIPNVSELLGALSERIKAVIDPNDPPLQRP